MKKRRHWVEKGNYSVLYGTACRVIVEDIESVYCIAEWFVHVFAFVILKATGIDRLWRNHDYMSTRLQFV